MSEADFRAKRRQKFLTEKYFLLNKDDIERTFEAIDIGRRVHAEQGKISASNDGASFKEALRLVRLHYTAGATIESLRPLFAEVMKWFVEWHRAEEAYSKWLAKKQADDLRTDMSPVEFGELFHFQLALDVVSLGILLGEGDSVRNAASLMQCARHTDMLFETLIESSVPDPDTTVTEFFHNRPYDPLLDAVYSAETPEAASAFVKTYLDGWYKAFEGVPWHNGHLVMTNEYSNYEGYWAFEAAAVCVLKGINDTSFRDHLVYPKDLADWARAHNVADLVKFGSRPIGLAAQTLRCAANHPCPQTCWWMTPAKAGSRRYFNEGEIMPSLGGDYGLTIWQWDVDQSAPKL